MAKLNVDAFSEEYRDVAPKECACFLVECLSETERTKITLENVLSQMFK